MRTRGNHEWPAVTGTRKETDDVWLPSRAL
jgi:hypothetical protein